jgi:hypothetical protein
MTVDYKLLSNFEDDIFHEFSGRSDIPDIKGYPPSLPPVSKKNRDRLQIKRFLIPIEFRRKIYSGRHLEEALC